MRRVLLILALVFPVYAGTVTQANMKLSQINGAAFVDFSGSDSAALTGAAAGSTLVVTDQAGKNLTGYIKTAGTAETYGTEKIPNSAFSATTSVNTTGATVASVAGGQSGNYLQITLTGSAGNGRESVTGLTSGMLLKASAYLQVNTSSYQYMVVQEGTGSFAIVRTGPHVTPATWTQNTLYATADGSSMIFVWNVSGTSTQTAGVDTASMTQVLTPANTGVTITSTPNGSTYNWAAMDSGFNLNDPGGYTYTITGSSVALPTFSSGTSNYHRVVPPVTIGEATSGASVCYRLDGGTPTATVAGTCDSPALTYSSPISITTSGTVLKAIGTKAGVSNSAVVTATYTIGLYITTAGDSLTAGNQDGTGVTYPSLLGNLTGATIHNEGVGGYTSTQIASAFLAATAYFGNAVVIWAGENNFSDPTTVLADVASMVAAISPNTQYLVLSVITGANSRNPGTPYDQIMALNASLAAAYPNNYLDVLTPLVASYDPNNAVDVINHTAGIPPSTAKVNYVNSGTLTNDIASSGITNFVFTSTSGQLYTGVTLTIDSEKMYVSLSGPTGTGPYSYTVTFATRGYAGTTAAAHTAGAVVSSIIDPVHLNSTKGDVIVANAVRNKLASMGILPSVGNALMLSIP